MQKFTETHPRTLIKTIFIRVLFTMSLIMNMYLAHGTWMQILAMLPLATISAMSTFWVHERVWNYAQWNRKPKETFFFHEGQPRTIAKSVTWRAAISLNNLIVPFIVTGSWGTAAVYLGLATVVNALIFYLNERLWNRISWGKKVIEI